MGLDKLDILETLDILDNLEILVLSQSTEQFVVLGAIADGDAQTVVAELDARAVADNNAFVDQVVIDGLRVGHLCQEEIGIGLIHLFADGQFLECGHQTATLGKQNLDVFVDFVGVFQHLQRLLLGELVDVIGILHLIIYINDILRGESHA